VFHDSVGIREALRAISQVRDGRVEDGRFLDFGVRVFPIALASSGSHGRGSLRTPGTLFRIGVCLPGEAFGARRGRLQREQQQGRCKRDPLAHRVTQRARRLAKCAEFPVGSDAPTLAATGTGRRDTGVRVRSRRRFASGTPFRHNLHCQCRRTPGSPRRPLLGGRVGSCGRIVTDGARVAQGVILHVAHDPGPVAVRGGKATRARQTRGFADSVLEVVLRAFSAPVRIRDDVTVDHFEVDFGHVAQALGDLGRVAAERAGRTRVLSVVAAVAKEVSQGTHSVSVSGPARTMQGLHTHTSPPAA
jgi:hypothetical protein